MMRLLLVPVLGVLCARTRMNFVNIRKRLDVVRRIKPASAVCAHNFARKNMLRFVDVMDGHIQTVVWLQAMALVSLMRVRVGVKSSLLSLLPTHYCTQGQNGFSRIHNVASHFSPEIIARPACKDAGMGCPSASVLLKYKLSPVFPL